MSGAFPLTGGFQARCEPCDWEAPLRDDSLAALEDFDRHAEGPDHAAGEAAIAATTAAVEAQLEAERDDLYESQLLRFGR